MKKLLLLLALGVSPSIAQTIVPYPMPSPPPVATHPYVRPLEVLTAPQYPMLPAPIVPLPQGVYGVTPGTTMPNLAPDFVIQPSLGGTTIYRTVPGTSMYDITQPMYIIK